MTTTAPPPRTVQARDASPVGTALDSFAGVDPRATYGAGLRQVREAAAAFRRDFTSTGTPDLVSTHDLVTLPYPTRFGLWRAALTPSPYLWITNRMLVVQWTDASPAGGIRRTMLFEPSDHERGEATPYFADMARRTPDRLQDHLVTRHSTVPAALARAGIALEDVDYLVFDHLHTQDVRRWVGTTAPQADLGGEVVAPLFPRAQLLVQREELAAMQDLHPLQRPWYQPATYADLPPERIVALDGDVLLGPGVALLATPGHTLGNQSLVLNTSTGVWAVSEDVIAVECLVPQHSSIPGVARHARQWQREVVLNTNTPEALADQYNSCIKEKAVVDDAQSDGRFPQFLPSSELTPSRFSPGTRPTFVHRQISHRSVA